MNPFLVEPVPTWLFITACLLVLIILNAWKPRR